MKFTNINPNPPMKQCVRKEETYILVVKVNQGVWFAVMLHYTIILHYCNLTLMQS